MKSTDGGTQWSYLSMGLVVDTVFALALDPLQPQTIYAGSERGLFRSRDGGVQWDRQTQGLAGDAVYALAADADRPGALYAATSEGVFWSATGDLWQQLGKGAILGPLYEVLVSGSAPGVVYVAGGRGVWRSNDRGGRWAQATGGLPTGPVLSLAASSQQPGLVYAATNHGPYVTSNEGRAWTAVQPGLPAEGVFYVTPSQHVAGRMYTSVRDVVYRRNDGADWQQQGPALLCDSFPGRTWVLRLAESPRVAQRLYAGSERGLFVSNDGGASWACPQPFDFTWVQVGAIVFDPTDANTIYIGTSGPPYRNYLVPSGDDAGGLPRPISASSANDWLPALLVLIAFIAGSVLILVVLLRRYRQPARR
jgi:photosystem II stability/assembly factor-like uncharacterized protein